MSPSGGSALWVGVPWGPHGPLTSSLPWTAPLGPGCDRISLVSPEVALQLPPLGAKRDRFCLPGRGRPAWPTAEGRGRGPGHPDSYWIRCEHTECLVSPHSCPEARPRWGERGEGPVAVTGAEGLPGAPGRTGALVGGGHTVSMSMYLGRPSEDTVRRQPSASQGHTVPRSGTVPAPELWEIRVCGWLAAWPS